MQASGRSALKGDFRIRLRARSASTRHPSRAWVVGCVHAWRGVLGRCAGVWPECRSVLKGDFNSTRCYRRVWSCSRVLREYVETFEDERMLKGLFGDLRRLAGVCCTVPSPHARCSAPRWSARKTRACQKRLCVLRRHAGAARCGSSLLGVLVGALGGLRRGRRGARGRQRRAASIEEASGRRLSPRRQGRPRGEEAPSAGHAQGQAEAGRRRGR